MLWRAELAGGGGERAGVERRKKVEREVWGGGRGTSRDKVEREGRWGRGTRRDNVEREGRCGLYILNRMVQKF